MEYVPVTSKVQKPLPAGMREPLVMQSEVKESPPRLFSCKLGVKVVESRLMANFWPAVPLKVYTSLKVPSLRQSVALNCPFIVCPIVIGVAVGQVPAWLTVNACPPMRTVPVRGNNLELAKTE